MAEWIDVEKARDLPGLRLVLTTGLPGPWGEAAKGIFHVKRIPFARVRQDAGGANDALFAWTGHRNAPIAVFADEPARTGWSEILFLAERLAPEPSLIPVGPHRARVDVRTRARAARREWLRLVPPAALVPRRHGRRARSRRRSCARCSAA